MSPWTVWLWNDIERGWAFFFYFIGAGREILKGWYLYNSLGLIAKKEENKSSKSPIFQVSVIFLPCVETFTREKNITHKMFPTFQHFTRSQLTSMNLIVSRRLMAASTLIITHIPHDHIYYFFTRHEKEIWQPILRFLAINIFHSSRPVKLGAWTQLERERKKREEFRILIDLITGMT